MIMSTLTCSLYEIIFIRVPDPSHFVKQNKTILFLFKFHLQITGNHFCPSVVSGFKNVPSTVMRLPWRCCCYKLIRLSSSGSSSSPGSAETASSAGRKVSASGGAGGAGGGTAGQVRTGWTFDWPTG